MESKHDPHRVEELLHKDHYTLAEVAYVLDMPSSSIYSAIMSHKLHALVIGRDVVSITRKDLIDWLRRRDQGE
jgi:hypothetical protein